MHKNIGAFISLTERKIKAVLNLHCDIEIIRALHQRMDIEYHLNE